MPKIKAKKAVNKSGPRKSAVTKKKVVKKVAQKVTPAPQKAAVPQRALVVYEALAYETALINAELAVTQPRAGGKPYQFDPKTLAEVLRSYKEKHTQETIAAIMKCHVHTLQNVLKKSPTLWTLVSRAKDYLRGLAMIAVEYKLQVVPAHWEETIDKKTGEKTTQWVEAREPTDFFLRYVLEHQAPDEFGALPLSEKDNINNLTINDNRIFTGEKAKAYRELEQEVLGYGRKQHNPPSGN